MHRSEPGVWNRKYWWRKVSPRPVLGQLVEQGHAVGYVHTTPADFVDFCERVRGTGTAEEEVARNVQALEWQLLFDWCYRKAVG